MAGTKNRRDPVRDDECPVGAKIHRWTILEVFKKDNRYWTVKAQCECGKIKEVHRHSIVAGRSKSCGCYSVELTVKYFTGRPSKLRKPKGYAGATAAINEYQRSAATKGRPFELSREQAIAIMEQNCMYCGVEPQHRAVARSAVKTDDGFKNCQFVHNGIDRIDSDIGYTLENCVPCCGKCNFMKRHHPLQDWLDQMRTILSREEEIFSKIFNK